MPEFTSEQQQAIGRLVCDHWGANFQTRDHDMDGCYVLYAQMGPSHPTRRFEVDRAGKVTERA